MRVYSNGAVRLVAAAACGLFLSGMLLAQGGPGGRGFGPGPSNGATAVGAPSADEVKLLQFMREEEKMARDIYQALGEKWELVIFSNITRSEQRHFESVGALLERYGIEDPSKDMGPGQFRNPELTALYGQLMTKGALSAKDALEVGVAVEKADIADLERALPAVTKTDIKRVFSNLLRGSLNHLDAFERALSGACTAQ